MLAEPVDARTPARTLYAARRLRPLGGSPLGSVDGGGPAGRLRLTSPKLLLLLRPSPAGPLGSGEGGRPTLPWLPPSSPSSSLHRRPVAAQRAAI